MTRGYDYGRWMRPVAPWPSDAERWRRFCAEIDQRIATVRESSGRDDLGTFSPPMRQLAPKPDLPGGRVAPVPTNTDRRDGHGRFAPRADLVDLLQAGGPSDPAWRARVRAAFQEAV